MSKNPTQKFPAKFKEVLENTLISYSIQYLTCSKTDCLPCLLGQGHGPYWFANYYMSDEIRSIFLGKSFKPVDLNKILLNDMLRRKQQEMKNQPFTDSTQLRTKKQNKAWLIDRIDTHKITPKKPKNKSPLKVVPTKLDFERDLVLLKSVSPPSRLKKVYKKLIKKYHPDQFAGNPLMNEWMSEINCQYHKILLKVGEFV